MSEHVITASVKNRTIELLGANIELRDLGFIFICFIFFYLHLFAIPNTPIFYENDHIALLNDAHRMHQGEMIYRDFFEFTFPGAQTLYFLLFVIFGERFWILNAVILFNGVLGAFLCLKIAKEIIGNNVYAFLPPTIYVFFGFRWFGLDGEHRMLSTQFAYLAILLLLTKRTPVRIVLAGISCAFASFITQQRGVLALAAIGTFFIFEFLIADRNWKQFLRSSILLVGTFICTLFLLLLPFLVIAGPELFYADTFLFLRNYVQDPTTNSFRTYFHTISKVMSVGYLMTAVAFLYSLLIPLIYLVTLIYLWIKRNDRAIRHKEKILLVCLLGIFLSLGTLAPNIERLFQIAVPALVLLGYFISRFRVATPKFMVAVVAILICFGIGLGIRLQQVWDIKVLSGPKGNLAFLRAIDLERYSWLSENANTGDLVYETYNAQVNFPLGLDNPSRISVLLNSGYSPDWQVRMAIEDVTTKRPRFIIWDGAWTGEIASSNNVKLKPFYEFLISHYRLRQQTTPYDGRQREIWELKGN